MSQATSQNFKLETSFMESSVLIFASVFGQLLMVFVQQTSGSFSRSLGRPSRQNFFTG